MLLEEDRVSRLREMRKKMGLAIKQGVPAEKFLNHLTASAEQVQNLHMKVQVRDHEVHIDEPVPMGGDDFAPSPLETLLAAVAGCKETTWVLASSILDMAVDKVEVNVEGSIDRRYMQDPSVPARLQSIRITSRVTTSEPQEKMEMVFGRLQQMLPMTGSLSEDIEKEFLLVVIPPNE
jgi:uncharacterized OsmC-like protein